jgi:uncharacterized protein YhaN
MKTVDDALAFCARENDPFYVSAFMIEAWLSDVTLKTVDQYADRKSAKNRRLQQGLAAESYAAIIGIQQRHFRDMSDFQKSWWEWHHGEAADRLSDPSKWTMIGKAMADVSSTHQNYPALDECIIMLWPLVRRHHWTYRDLMHVIRSVAPVPLRYPCEREQDLASYCINVLGLRKNSKKGKSDPNGTPPGMEIARAMSAL